MVLEFIAHITHAYSIGSNGRSASVLEDRRQTARLNLVVSAPNTPVPVKKSDSPARSSVVVCLGKLATMTSRN